jgi:CheY-like chemotaxis protein
MEKQHTELQFLFVDSNRIVLNALESIAHQFGIQTTAVTDAASALDLVTAQQFDCIMINLELNSSASSYALTTMIRNYEKAVHRYPALIISMMDEHSEEVIQESLQSGTTIISRAPIKKSDFVEFIEICNLLPNDYRKNA